MKKNNKKGFLLTEAVIVITFISVVLFFLFSQINTIFSLYEKSFNYNTVDGLYRSQEVKTFLLNTNFYELVNQLQADELYVEFSDCSFSNVEDFCNHLIIDLEIEKVYFVKEDITGFITYVENSHAFDELVVYLDYINYDRDYKGYRIIVEFSDGQFASINFL